MGPPIMYQTSTKWLWNPDVKKPKKNTMGMGVHRIVEQMGKVDLENQVKTIYLLKATIGKTWELTIHDIPH
jgi:hypothetical protein